MSENFFNPNIFQWSSVSTLPSKSYVCGYCGFKIATDQGYALKNRSSNICAGGVYLCHQCMGPTFFAPSGVRVPSSPLGLPVDHVPDELNALYEEARRCTSQECHTAAVLLCRKALMNIAVSKKAKEGETFKSYVEYLAAKGFVPPDGIHWVNHIKDKGNEATHEIKTMTKDDAAQLLTFLGMLLTFIFTFPKLLPEPPQTADQPAPQPAK